MNTLLASLALPLLLGAAARGENWPQWRGPFFNGSTPEQDLPAEWGKTNNVAWVTPLPGRSSATPVVWGDSVFVSSPDEQKHLLLLCLDAKTGKVRWQKQVAEGDRQTGLNNLATPSPVTDGKIVVAMFGTGDLAAFDFNGRELWKRNLATEYGRFANMWMYGSSPMLDQGKLYIQALQSNPRPDDYAHAQGDPPARESWLLCADLQTGTNLWRHIRPSNARGEAQEAYSTPIPFAGRSGREIILVGGNFLTAHSAETGTELWRCAGLNPRNEFYWRTVPSPVAAGDLLLGCGPKGDPLIAVRDGGQGLVTDTHIAWKLTEHTPDCVTPLFYRQLLYVLDGDHQVMTCIDPATGAKQWSSSLGVKEIFRASPTGADGRIYCISERGTVVVLAAADACKVLATFRMGESPVRSSIVAAQGALFIRTACNLYCIRKGAFTKSQATRL